MATIQNIPEDVLETHILPLATEESELRENINMSVELIEKQNEELKELRKKLLEAQEQIKNHHKRNRKNEKRLTYYKGQIDYLVSSSSNYTYDESDY